MGSLLVDLGLVGGVLGCAALAWSAWREGHQRDYLLAAMCVVVAMLATGLLLGRAGW